MSGIFIGIPILNRFDLLIRCLDHIDIPADILIINNNTTDPVFNDLLYRLVEERDLQVYSPRYNLGVAASWNRIIQTGMGWGYEEIYIGSNDTFLRPGTLNFCHTREREEDAAIWHLCDWNFWCIPIQTIHHIGWFDENFYPAYREDQDYSYRCDFLSSLSRYCVSDHAMPNVEVMPNSKGYGGQHLRSQTVASDSEYARHNSNTHNNWNSSHYVMKWGGLPGCEKYTTPYDGSKDLRWWPDPKGTIAVRDWDNQRKRIR